MMKAAHFITVFLFALVAGVFWGTWFSLSRSIDTISPSAFLEIGRTMIANLAWPMRFLMPGAMVASIWTLFLLRPSAGKSFYLGLTGLLLFVVALLITLLVNVPIDNLIKAWTVATLPSEWQQVRERWEFFHALRTFASLGALASVIASSIVRTEKPH